MARKWDDVCLLCGTPTHHGRRLCDECASWTIPIYEAAKARKRGSRFRCIVCGKWLNTKRQYSCSDFECRTIFKAVSQTAHQNEMKKKDKRKKERGVKKNIVFSKNV